MQLYPLALLLFIPTFLTEVSCAEFHAEHQAVHNMGLVHQRSALWHRSETHKMRASVNARDATMNMSTALVDYKSEFAGLIGVGTNADGRGQFQARIIFDTGSTNLWVASKVCHQERDAFMTKILQEADQLTICDTQRSLEFYDPNSSTTQESFLQGNSHDIFAKFGTGVLSGPLHVDTLRVGPFEVKKQPFAMVRSMTGNVFQKFPFEGILGLAFPDMSSNGIVPFLEHVIEQKVLPHNEFAFFMNVDSSKPSALLWGGVDKDLYHGKIQMFPVVQPHYWSLELVDFKVGNTSMKGAGLGSLPVKRLIVDSGTTYFTAPPGLHQEILKQVPDASCDKVKDYPPLTYVLKGADDETYDLVVTQETYMISEKSNNCFAAIMPLKADPKFGPAMLLGEVFMKHFFTVFSRGDGDVKNAKIGFAPANIGATPKVQPVLKPASFLESSSDKSARSGSRSISLDSRAQMRSSQLHRDAEDN